MPLPPVQSTLLAFPSAVAKSCERSPIVPALEDQTQRSGNAMLPESRTPMLPVSAPPSKETVEGEPPNGHVAENCSASATDDLLYTGQMLPYSPSTPAGCLFPGARFVGYQIGQEKSYDVNVVIKHVDLERSYLCGDLTIYGLTEQYPELITFFDAEIVGPEHSFETGKWQATPDIDRVHWSKFPAFAHVDDKRVQGVEPYDFRQHDAVFMRWKEHFLVPDHTVQAISGASFAGFYYICVSLSKGAIEGYYFHAASELFQYVKLHLETPSQFASYDLH